MNLNFTIVIICAKYFCVFHADDRFNSFTSDTGFYFHNIAFWAHNKNDWPNLFQIFGKHSRTFIWMLKIYTAVVFFFKKPGV